MPAPEVQGQLAGKDAQRGWLSAKDYPDPTTGNPGTIGPDYTYKPSGRLWTRTWARGNPRIQTTYTYNNAGDLETVTYNDGTPSITYTYGSDDGASGNDSADLLSLASGGRNRHRTADPGPGRVRHSEKTRIAIHRNSARSGCPRR